MRRFAHYESDRVALAQIDERESVSWTAPDWDDTGSTHNSMGVDGPEGLGMFCHTHFEGAIQLRRLTQAEAVARLQKDATTSIGKDPYPEGS
jgi:hypothetical protein